MADKTINLKIKVAPVGDTKKSLDNLQKIATNWDKAFGPNGDKPVKNTKRQVDLLTRSWEDLGKSIKLATENFKLGFDAGSSSMRGLSNFTRGIEGAAKKVFNLKNAIAGTVVGAGALYLGHKLFEEGAQQIKTRKRLRREFGAEAGDIQGAASRINFAAGIQDDDAARGLIPLAEQLQAIQGGSQFRGMKKPLTEAQASSLRKKNLNFGADIFRRVSTLVPDVESEDLGRILGDALAGPEGIRTMVSQLQLSKRSKTLSQANEKGQAFKVLSPEERKQFGITKAGQFLEQGDLVNLLLSRSGLTDAAAKDEQKTFGHQIKQIKSSLMDQIGDIGSGALDTLSEKLGKGATAAERLNSFLASKEGKHAIDGIKETVVHIVEGVAKIAQKLPEIGGWLKEHKGLLAGIAGAYGIAKLAPTAVGLAKGASAVLGLSRGGNPAMPLYVTNVGGAPGAGGGSGILGKLGAVAAAGAAGYAAGTWLDNKFHLSDKIAGTGAKTDAAGEDRNSRTISERADARKQQIKALEEAGLSHGKAVYYAEHQKELQVAVQTNLVIDGVVLAKLVEKHQTRAVDNRTGRGASPVSKE